MSRYQITAPDGRTITVEGDHPPTQEEASAIIASAGGGEQETVPPGSHRMPDGSIMADSEMQGGAQLPKAGVAAPGVGVGLTDPRIVEGLKSAAKATLAIGQGLDYPQQQVLRALLRAGGAEQAAGALEESERGAAALAEKYLGAPQDASRGVRIARFIGGAVPATAALMAGPGGVPAAAALGGALGGAQTLGETGDIKAAATSGAIAAGLPFAGRAVGRQLAKLAPAIKTKAAEQFARLVGVKPGEAARLVKFPERAEEMMAALGVGRRATLAKRAGEALGTASRRLKGIKARSAETPFEPTELVEAAANVRASTPRLKYPPVPKSKVPPTEPPWFKPPGTKVPSAPKSVNRAQLRATQQVARDLEDIATRYVAAGKPIPGKEMFKIRTQFGEAGKAAYGKLVGEKTAAAAGAAKKGQAEVSKLLQDAIPGLKKRDLTYSQWQTVADALERLTFKSVVSGKPGTAPILGAREFLLAGTGMLSKQALPAYGAFQMARDILVSPLYRSLSAQGRFALARILRTGKVGTGAVARIAGLQAARAKGKSVAETNREKPEPVEAEE